MDITIDARELDELADYLAKVPIVDFLVEIMERAEQIVNYQYSQQAWAENINFTTNIVTGKDSATLVVSGEDVGFLEFGAGFGVEPTNEFAQQVGFPIYKGSYSDERRGMFSRTHYTFWIWHDEEYNSSNPVMATRGMQKALTNLRNTVLDYIRKRIISYLNNGR